MTDENKNNSNSNSDASNNQSKSQIGNQKKAEYILLSLHAMVPELSEEQIKHIYFHQCKQDFNQSIEYLSPWDKLNEVDYTLGFSLI
jgi:hypothetical protein